MLRCLLALALLLSTVTRVSAQETTGSIVGVIKDSSGSVIPGAQIAATRTDTGVESRTTSDDQGSY